jgi:hypothetical protein
MNINEVAEAISDIENKKFTEFSKKVKTSLEDKLRNNPTITAKGEELEKLQSMKNTFAKISNPTTKTPEVKVETPKVEEEPEAKEPNIEPTE